jgi:hypothetical protein
MADRESHQDGKDGGGGRGPLVAVAVMVLLIAIGWLVVRELTATARLQDCLMSGRTNCAPVEAPK